VLFSLALAGVLLIVCFLAWKYKQRASQQQSPNMVGTANNSPFVYKQLINEPITQVFDERRIDANTFLVSVRSKHVDYFLFSLQLMSFFASLT
jgi:hypothetical protein